VVDLRWLPELTEPDSARLREFLLDVHAADSRPEVGDTGLPRDFAGGEHLFAGRGEDLVGYAHLDTGGDVFGRTVGELFVRPDARRAGIGGSVLAELLSRAGAADSTLGDRVRVWAHGDHPGAARLAERFGMSRVREMHRMRRDLSSASLPEAPLPAGVRIRSFVPGLDEPEFLRVNSRAFSWHPEQGALSMDELLATEQEGWFDRDGFLLAEAGGKLVGFHWTKIHQRAAADSSGRPMGEVYVIGVDPEGQGGGLGKALTVAGLRYLADAGLDQVMLYVESDNPAAIAVYRKLGFEIWDTDVQYSR
jgi:mycothiol synthase